MVEFVKIGLEGEAAAVEADLLSVLIEKGEKPDSSSRASGLQRDSSLPVAERNAPFISPERKVEFSKA